MRMISFRSLMELLVREWKKGETSFFIELGHLDTESLAKLNILTKTKSRAGYHSIIEIKLGDWIDREMQFI